MSEAPEALATVLLHESLHCLMAHNERFANLAEPEKDPHIWNLCGDCAINHVLDDAEMPWTENVTPVRYSNYEDTGIESRMITETSYAQIMNWRDETGAQEDPRFTPPDCGSAAGGALREYELDKNDENSPSFNSEQKTGIRDQVAGEILIRGNSRGDMPGGLLRWAQDHLEPQIDWRKQLGTSLRKAVATVAGRQDYSYMRPSRRQEAMRLIGSPVLLPSLRQPSPPRVSVVVDTSGSISDLDLRMYLGEISGIIKAVGISGGVQVIACDVEAQPAQTFKSAGRLDEVALVGGGGTDMRKGIEASLSSRPKPDVVVVITDGLTPWPEEKPKSCDFFTAVLTSSQEIESVPNWMRTVLIN
jgi:predicted metal-dependent peptidase